MKKNVFQSKVFATEEIALAKTTEMIVRGGRDKFGFLPKAFEGIKQIGVIGWGSQGPAQAMNLKDSLEGTGIIVKVGLQENSTSFPKARKEGFTEESGTLGNMWDVIAESDLVILLIKDDAQVEHYKRIFKTMKPGATLGFSHGFLEGYLEITEESFPKHINVIGVCPKGMGPSVRRLYVQGKETDGAGINCSFAVEQDLDGRATDIALGWAIALGAPVIFMTTLKDERNSDIFGERGGLLGGVHGLLEALYRFFIMELGMSLEAAFEQSVENLTGSLTPIISKHGILGVFERAYSKDNFMKAFHSAYYPYYELLREIYDEVSSGNEIRSVVMAGKRLDEFGWTEIGETKMWKEVGVMVRVKRKSNPPHMNDITGGLYCAMMMAQINVLMENGHCLSEICNETVIEAVDSLNPYMHFKGVDYMVDNCSTTARLGTRKWAPRFDHVTMQRVFVNFNDGKPVDSIWVEKVKGHSIHEALRVCQTLRPNVDISVVG